MAFKATYKGVVILLIIGIQPYDEVVDKLLEEWASSGLNTEIDEIWEQERIEEERKSHEALHNLAKELEDI